MQCRKGCGACCIAPSISSVIPNMPEGKLAGEPCVQLDGNNLCKLFGNPSRPDVCLVFQASDELCGESSEFAFQSLAKLEQDSAP